MEKNIKEAISIIEDVRRSMPECTNKAFLKGAINELNEALAKQKKLNHIYKPEFNAKDYLVLNPMMFKLGKNQIAVGVVNFALSGQSCLMQYTYEGKIYERRHSEHIPESMIGQVCSVQIYELKK